MNLEQYVQWSDKSGFTLLKSYVALTNECTLDSSQHGIFSFSTATFWAPGQAVKKALVCCFFWFMLFVVLKDVDKKSRKCILMF